MSPLGFQDYLELWQEQIGEEELAGLRVRAKAIARGVNRRRLLDVTLAALAVGTTCMFLWLYSPSLQVTLCFVLMLAMMIGLVWRRHRIAMAARAIAVDHPRFFFDSAIRNVQSELNLSRFSLWIGWPGFLLLLILAKAARGADVVDWLRNLPRDVNFVGLAILMLGFSLGHLFFLRQHRQIREQLRRLETMRREWDDQATR